MIMVPADDAILAVDCGSSSLKAGVYTRSLEALGSISTPVHYRENDAGRVEFDGELIWDAFAEMVGTLIRQSAVPPELLKHLSLGSQAQTFAVVDGAGALRTPFYSWLDRRAEAEADMVRRELGSCFHAHCSFSPPVAQLQLCKMLWLSRHKPAVWEGDAHVVTLPAFLAGRLGGGFVTDRNMAAMGGAYSIALGSWWPAALSLCGVSAWTMGELVDVGATITVRGKSRLVDVSPESITYAGNDQTVGAYGNGCDETTLLVTLGTALVAYRVRGDVPGPYHEGSFWGPYPGGRYYELATLDEGCLALEWARKQILPHASATAFDALVQDAIDQGESCNAPLFRPQRLRHDTAWSYAATPRLMAYSVLEGIAFSLRRLLEDVFRCEQIPMIRVIGGGSRSRVWLGIMADVMHCPVCCGAGDALLGAAALAIGVDPSTSAPWTATVQPHGGRVAALTARYRQWCSG